MNNLNKIINLIKKTGDKFVIMDEDGASFVVMPLSDYEKIVGGRDDYSRMSEKELLDSVERDIALWRAEHEDYEDYEDMEPPIPEPWEMERPWEREPWEHEPLPWDEDEDGEEDEDFVAPRYDWHGNEIKEKEVGTEHRSVREESEPIKYEDIPPPPDVNIDDIMGDEKNKEEIIDMSFDEDEGGFDEEEEEEKGDFMEEAIF